MNKKFLKGVVVAALLLCTTQAAFAARTELTPFTAPTLTASSISANAADLTFVGSDSANGYQFASTGREYIIAWNTHATTAYTCTVTSVAINGRTNNLPSGYSLAAGEIGCFGPYPTKGWRQTNGKIYIDANNDAVKFAIVRIP
jgi:hypothetical protein